MSNLSRSRFGLKKGDRAVGPGALRILYAVLRLRDAGRKLSVRTVCAEVGLSINSVRWALERLQKHGLVAWDRKRSGTLRPLCRVTLFMEAKG